MKFLTLVRHAKSSWEDPLLPDRERPLNKRGRRDAPAMGARLADRGCHPELILSSPATRALSTAHVIAEALDYPVDRIVVDERIYEDGAEGILAAVHDAGGEADRIMLFGHNPDLTWLINRLSGIQLDNLPTCGVAMLQFAIPEWTDLGASTALEAEIDYPKRLPAS